MLKVISFLTFITLLTFTSQAISAKECPKGSYLVRSHPRSAYYRSEGTHVSATTVASYCKRYRDLKPLNALFKNKIPKKWPHKKERFKSWKKREKQIILDLLTKLPKILTQIGNLRIYRATKSHTPNNPATSAPANNIIVFYDSTFTSDNDAEKILVHELAHILYQSLSEDEKIAYWNSSDWKLNRFKKPVTSRIVFSEPDGGTGPEEDFANNVEHFLANRKKFNNIQPKISSCLKSLLGVVK